MKLIYATVNSKQEVKIGLHFRHYMSVLLRFRNKNLSNQSHSRTAELLRSTRVGDSLVNESAVWTNRASQWFIKTVTGTVPVLTLVVFAFDRSSTYMTYFLYLAEAFKWTWRPRVCVELLIIHWHASTTCFHTASFTHFVHLTLCTVKIHFYISV